MFENKRRNGRLEAEAFIKAGVPDPRFRVMDILEDESSYPPNFKRAALKMRAEIAIKTSGNPIRRTSLE